MRLRKHEINFFFHMRVKGIFVSQRNCVSEIAGGLKENRLDTTGFEKVKRRGKLLGLSATPWRTHMGIETQCRHKIYHPEQILSSVCGGFLRGCRDAYSDVGPLWEMLGDCIPPLVRR